MWVVFFSFFLCAVDFEGTSWDVVVAVLGYEDVLAPVLHHIRDVVDVSAGVLHVDFVARAFGPVQGHEQNIVSC